MPMHKLQKAKAIINVTIALTKPEITFTDVNNSPEP